MSEATYLTSDRNWAGQLIRQAREIKRLSLRALAVKAGTSHPTLAAYEQGRKSPTAETLHRILSACDLAVDVTLRPRIREQSGLDRGAELEAALRLAEQFPTRHQNRWQAPIFHKAAAINKPLEKNIK